MQWIFSEDYQSPLKSTRRNNIYGVSISSSVVAPPISSQKARIPKLSRGTDEKNWFVQYLREARSCVLPETRITSREILRRCNDADFAPQQTDETTANAQILAMIHGISVLCI